jgi:internalin A
MKLWKALLTVMVLSLACGAAFAEPSVKRSGNSFTVVEAVNDEILSQIKAEMGQVKQEQLGFRLEGIKDEDLAKLCAAYPHTVTLSIASDKITSIAPVAGLKGLTRLSVQNISGTLTDPTPIAALTELRNLDVMLRKITVPDLKWMSGLTKLTFDIRLELGWVGEPIGLTSFEGIPPLPKVTLCTIKFAAPADLTPLVKALPAVENVTLEHNVIQDLTPLAQLAKLERLILTSSTVKDFSPLGGHPTLEKLNINRVKGVSSLAPLKQLPALKELRVTKEDFPEAELTGFDPKVVIVH